MFGVLNFVSNPIGYAARAVIEQIDRDTGINNYGLGYVVPSPVAANTADSNEQENGKLKVNFFLKFKIKLFKFYRKSYWPLRRNWTN